jgi:hypothetical protein
LGPEGLIGLWSGTRNGFGNLNSGHVNCPFF